MLRGVPVLGEDDVIEFFGEGVDQGDDGVAVGYGEVAAGHEVVLDVDDEEGVGGLELHDESMVVQLVRSAVVLRTRPTLATMRLSRTWGTQFAARVSGFWCPGWCRF